MSRKEERRYTSARERAEKQSTGFTSPYLRLPDGVQLFKPKTGVMLLDILPFVAGDGNPWAEAGNLHWERTYNIHRGIGANNDSFLCPRMTSKSPCPICEHRLKLMKSEDGDEDTEQMVKDMGPKQRQLFNIINLKEPDKGVQIWDISYHLFGKVLDARLRNSDEEDGWDKFFFLEDGFTLKVGFVEKTFAGFTYIETETIDFKPRRQPYDDDILEQVHCLDELLIETPYDELKKIYLQTEAGDDDDAPAPKKKARPVEDDDDDDAPPPKKKPAPPADDDDAAPLPKKKVAPPADDDDDAPTPKPKKKAPAGDDWDDFDDDAPAPKKKVAAADDDAPPPKRKPAPPADDDDEPPAKPKRRPVEDDDDEPPRVKSGVPKDDDDDDAPPPKRKPVVDDDDDAPAPKKKPAPADDDDWDDAPPRKPVRK
jgi:hypothetical protein